MHCIQKRILKIYHNRYIIWLQNYAYDYKDRLYLISML